MHAVRHQRCASVPLVPCLASAWSSRPVSLCRRVAPRSPTQSSRCCASQRPAWLGSTPVGAGASNDGPGRTATHRRLVDGRGGSYEYRGRINPSRRCCGALSVTSSRAGLPRVRHGRSHRRGATIERCHGRRRVAGQLRTPSHRGCPPPPHGPSYVWVPQRRCADAARAKIAPVHGYTSYRWRAPPAQRPECSQLQRQYLTAGFAAMAIGHSATWCSARMRDCMPVLASTRSADVRRGEWQRFCRSRAARGCCPSNRTCAHRRRAAQRGVGDAAVAVVWRVRRRPGRRHQILILPVPSRSANFRRCDRPSTST
jgi:hypothetical protein